jgi:hypothetical protein
LAGSLLFVVDGTRVGVEVNAAGARIPPDVLLGGVSRARGGGDGGEYEGVAIDGENGEAIRTCIDVIDLK